MLHNHFSSISTSSGVNINPLFDNIITPAVDDIDNNELVKIPDVDEIKAVLFNMNAWCSPGPDGYPPGFFQTHWDQVGNCVVDFVVKFFVTGRLPEGVDESYISLVPKVDNPVCPADFRPVSLSNALYKLISKILATRLRNVLDKFISPVQSAFIPKRHLADNIVIAYEVLHSVKTDNKKKRLFCA